MTMPATGAQIQANVQEQGTVDDDGNVSIEFSPSTVSQSLYGKVAVVSSTPDVAWAASINGVPQGTVYGSTFSGPYSIKQGQTLTLSATNLQPGTVYTANFTGYSLTGPNPGFAIPTNLGSVAVIAEQVLATDPLGEAAGTLTIMAQPSWSTLRLIVSNGDTMHFDVTGTTTGNTYFDGYVEGGSPATAVIDPAVDLSYTVVVTGTGSFWITAQLDDDAVFVYTSPGQPAATYQVGGGGMSGEVAVGAGATVDMTTLPATGKCFRIQMFWEDLSSGVMLIGDSSTGAPMALRSTAGSLYMGGQLCFGKITVTNQSATGANAGVTYDEVVIPSIT